MGIWPFGCPGTKCSSTLSMIDSIGKQIVEISPKNNDFDRKSRLFSA